MLFKNFYLTICAFGFGLVSTIQIANLTTILQFAGFQSHLITYLWILAPITGLICQPIIGIISDNMHSKFGRRRPLFLVSTVLGLCGVLFLPFTSHPLLLILLIILLDLGANGNAQLSRALILDLTTGKERTRAFSWSSALSGLGSLCGGMLPWLLIHIFHFSNQPEYKGLLPLYIKYTFVISAFFYLFFSCITLFMIKEKKTNKNLNKSQFDNVFLFFKKNTIKSIKKLPNIFWDLSYILLFAWIAVFSVWNFLNIDIAQTVFQMPTTSVDDMNKTGSYIAQANIWTSTYIGILQLSSTIFAFLIPFLNKYLRIQQVFTLGLFSGGISLILITATSNKYTIAILMVLYGVSWATLTICPYDIFAKIIPKKNNGYYMGIINMAVVIPQIVTGLFLGPLYKFVFSQQASKIILMAGFLLMVSALLSMRRQFNKATTHEAYIIADT
jgi:maltose/moltooligosaccharide transporter